ncbi:unnamed protein product [Prorocentrum cordatum]|uniref:non-specific serine/threonine protein kinase n=1 Tax=Prorocentrum cordatum TaxID=2364126 RepID=A0ABN9WY58_9DINO|nr:unnamed protein product [Polarella glacialis]
MRAAAAFDELYERLRVLGEGAYGTAFLVRQKDARELHVAKEIRTAHLTEKQREGALAEANVLKMMRHSNIIAYVDSFLEGSKMYIIMEYADGGDLAKKIRGRKDDGGTFQEAEIMFHFAQVAHALDHIHRRKVLHRDLKPLNIFLTSQGDVKLGDFGIARVLESTTAGAQTTIGTPFYLSPEVCNNEAYGRASDLWSLGVVTYEMAALRVPFHATSMPATALKIIGAEPDPLPQGYSGGFVRIVFGLLEKEPASRPSLEAVLQLPSVQMHISDLSRTLASGNGGIDVKTSVESEGARPPRAAARAEARASPGPLDPRHGPQPEPQRHPRPEAPRREAPRRPSWEVACVEPPDTVSTESGFGSEPPQQAVSFDGRPGSGVHGGPPPWERRPPEGPAARRTGAAVPRSGRDVAAGPPPPPPFQELAAAPWPARPAQEGRREPSSRTQAPERRQEEALQNPWIRRGYHRPEELPPAGVESVPVPTLAGAGAPALAAPPEQRIAARRLRQEEEDDMLAGGERRKAEVRRKAQEERDRQEAYRRRQLDQAMREQQEELRRLRARQQSMRGMEDEAISAGSTDEVPTDHEAAPVGPRRDHQAAPQAVGAACAEPGRAAGAGEPPDKALSQTMQCAFEFQMVDKVRPRPKLTSEAQQPRRPRQAQAPEPEPGRGGAGPAEGLLRGSAGRLPPAPAQRPLQGSPAQSLRRPRVAEEWAPQHAPGQVGAMRTAGSAVVAAPRRAERPRCAAGGEESGAD